MQLICNEIGIKRGERAKYTRDFNIIRDSLLSQMKNNEDFKTVFDGSSLFGIFLIFYTFIILFNMRFYYRILHRQLEAWKAR